GADAAAAGLARPAGGAVRSPHANARPPARPRPKQHEREGRTPAWVEAAAARGGGPGHPREAAGVRARGVDRQGGAARRTDRQETYRGRKARLAGEGRDLVAETKVARSAGRHRVRLAS